ncbi:hypothetical protein WA026_013070 [Henosepilachna vigintioctopunctata]|uniref:Uncharacterized protein n=1 Tax=Henosepilachna vigintioctopunctata TaxID=420089 RepID=A0AAW1UDL5_9CUCU
MAKTKNRLIAQHPLQEITLSFTFEMSMIQVSVLLFSYFVCGFTAPTRISVSCDRNGFNCNNIVNSLRLVIYQCPSNTKHVIAYLWNFGEPSNTAWITIRNCENVDLDMSCTSFRRPIHTLTIENATNLRFIRSVTTIKNPAKLVLRNIKNIEVIPENTFTIPYMVRYNGEAKEHELQEIEFENVHIGTIEGHAFHSLRAFRNFTWRNVEVDRIHANAIKIAFNTTYPTQGKFS